MIAKRQRDLWLKRQSALATDRSSWRDHWADISRHLLPRSGRFTKGHRNRANPTAANKIYDNTATRALRTLGAGMMAGATNPSRPWFTLTTEDPDLAKSHKVRRWLDDVVRRMQQTFARSNTYRTLHKKYEELGAFGTSVTVVTPHFENVIHHYQVPIGEYCLQQNYQGEVVSCFREFTKTVGETVKEFGLKNCSDTVKRLWEQSNLEAAVDLLHIIEPREDSSRDPLNPTAKHMPWRSVYLEMGEADGILSEGGYRRMPVLAPRWAVDGGDVYGTSPGMEALGDIKQLQQEQLRKGQGIDYMVRPPLQVPTALKQRETQLFPGGMSYIDPGQILPYDQANASGGVRPAFEVGISLDHLLLDIQDVRERIRSSFYADLFLMLSMAGPNTRMTATEVAERHEEKLLALGPVLTRLDNELLTPLVDLTFDAMNDAGMLPPPPEELEGVELNVEFVSILAQAQRAVGSNSVDRFMGSVMEVATMQAQTTGSADVLDKINIDGWVDNYSDMLGVDTDLIVDEGDVRALREARARMQAEAQQAELDQTKAKTAQAAATVKTDERNPVADVLNSGQAEEIL